jgi:hypothetical protein
MVPDRPDPDRDAELAVKECPAGGRDKQSPRSRDPNDPAKLECAPGEGRAEAARNVRAALRPIVAGPGEDPSPGPQRVDVDADRGEPHAARLGDLERVLVPDERAPLHEAFRDRHAEPAGEMVVTRSGGSKPGHDGRAGGSRRICRQGGELLERASDAVTAQADDVSAPVLDHCDETAVDQPPDVLTCRRHRCMRCASKRTDRVRRTVEQGIEHGGPARVGDQGGDAGKVGGRWHATSLFIINSSAAELTVLDRDGVTSGCLKRAI